MFADATLDHQWIHIDTEKAKEGPFGQTIVHGYLTLSLLPYLWQQIIEVNNLKMMVNYGMDNMKFGQAVLSGQSVRMVASLQSIANLRGICKVEVKFTIFVGNKVIIVRNIPAASCLPSRSGGNFLSNNPEMSDTYLTLSAPGESIYTEKRSRFLAFAMHVANEEEVKSKVAEFRKKYYDARHVCYAYALDFDASRTRANDDGEPSGSAGRPILGQLRSAGVTFTLVIVVRYFGGVKLGTGGLVVAYKTAAAEALQNATIEERIITANISFSVPYADADTAMRFVKEEGAEITARDYTATDTLLTASIRLDDEERLRQRLSKILSLHFTDAEEEP